MPRSIDFLQKQTYPYRDHKLGLKLLRILNKGKELTTNETRESLGLKSPYSQKKVRTTFERLNELGYCEEYENKSKLTKWISLESLNKSKHMKNKFIPAQLHSNWEKINNYTFHKKKSSNYILARITIDGEKQFCIENRIRRWNISFKGKLLLLIFEKQSFYKFIKETSNYKVIKRAQILLNSNKREIVDMLTNRLKKSYDIGFNLENIANEWYDETTKSISKMSLDKGKYPELVKLKSEIIDNEQMLSIMKTK